MMITILQYLSDYLADLQNHVSRQNDEYIQGLKKHIKDLKKHEEMMKLLNKEKQDVYMSTNIYSHLHPAIRLQELQPLVTDDTRTKVTIYKVNTMTAGTAGDNRGEKQLVEQKILDKNEEKDNDRD
jgi:hypothetical protein